MDLETGDNGPCKLLFVNRRNLQTIVKIIAPEMVLVPRSRFTELATGMLEIVENAAASD